MIPLFREKLVLEEVRDSLDEVKHRYKRGALEPLFEKKIFGVLTPF